MGTRALPKEQMNRVRAGLRQVVDAHGSQVKAARAIGISQQVLSRILAGDPAGLYVARKVATALKVDLDQLLRSPPNLDRVVRAHPGRWSDPAVAAVRALEVAELADSDVEALLDRATEALRPVLRLVR
jgi:hypothetical protein